MSKQPHYVVTRNEKPFELLGSPKSLKCHNVTGNGGRDGLKNLQDWVISSQAPKSQMGYGEGSTTVRRGTLGFD
mgnify:CR=1 FL=1